MSIQAAFGVDVQLYNEEVHDLLARNTNTKLQIHESKESGVYVAGLREDIVTSAENVLRILDEGEGSRHFGETRMNKQSSRSHTVFRMVSFQCAQMRLASLQSPPILLHASHCNRLAIT